MSLARPLTRRAATAAARTLLLASVTLLAACATRPPAEPGAERLSGRLSVRIDGQPDRSVSAGFELTGSARAGALSLTTPLGTTAAQARWQPGQAVLLANGSTQTFNTLDELVVQALGEAVPLAALFDWLRGRPWTDSPSTALADGSAGFVQLGWQVALGRFSEGWVEARRDTPPVVTVRARLDRDE